eukprot:TRINITY_DN3546_c0_g2_i2.p1 TRINITY_DN3546_c0_g2~~TRINITY_DN3546_c0_g2_i2.p1  ORF type:complete len:316 (+),score=35.54 TRINITY_DN3546_c0_g2_i2:53-1000(+)
MLFGRRISTDTASSVSGDLAPPEAKRRKTSDENNNAGGVTSENGTAYEPQQATTVTTASSSSSSSKADEIPAWGVEIIRNLAAVSSRLGLFEKGLEILLMEREQNLLAQRVQAAASTHSPPVPSLPPTSPESSSSLKFGGSTNTKSLSVNLAAPTSPYKEPVVDRVSIPALSLLEVSPNSLHKAPPFVLDEYYSYRLTRDSRRLLRMEPWNEKVLGNLCSDIAYENPKVHISALECQKMLVLSSELKSYKFPQFGIRLLPVDFVPPDPTEFRDSPVVCVKLSPTFKMEDDGLSSYKRLLRRIFEFEEKALDSFSI